MMEWKIGFYLFNHYDGIKFTQGVYLKSDPPHLRPPPPKKKFDLIQWKPF